MGLFDFSNNFDNAVSTGSSAVSNAGSSMLGGLFNSVSNLPGIVGDIATSTAARLANQTLTEARSLVSQRLTGMLNSVVPSSSNSILNSIGSQVRGAVGNQTGLILNGGVNSILQTVGIGGNTPIRQTNPTIYNNGVAAAGTIITEVNGGNRNVNGIVQNATEPLAALYHADQTYRAAQQVYAPAGASPYAMDLFKYAPKFAFLFVCEFTFETGFEKLGIGANGARNQFAMIIQDFDQPRISYDHEEYNYYNFRTKVSKRVTHENLKLRMLDDRENVSMNFIVNYLVMTHPIIGVSPTSAAFYEEAGMNWQISDTGAGIAYDKINSASLRAMPNDVINAIKEIKVYHIYDFGNAMNIYHFIRPKVMAVELDRWDMRGSADVATVGAEFAYDGLYVELGIPISKGEGDKLGNLSKIGTYPMHPHTNDGATVQTIPMSPSTSTTTTGTISAENQQGLDNLIETLNRPADQVSTTPVDLSSVQGTPLA